MRCLLPLLLLLLACQRPPAPRTVVERIVTLTPSLTEIVFALGAGDQVVGVSDYCDFPAEATRLPRVGTFLRPNMERILGLQPDLVLLDGVQRDVAAALEQAGLRVLALSMQSLGEVRQAFGTVGAAVGRLAEAQLLQGRLDAELHQAEARIAGQRRPRVLFVVDRQVGGLRGLVAAGPSTYLDELVRRAGGDNVFSDLPMRYAKVALEEVAARRPEVVLDAVHVGAGAASGALRDWQALPEVPAVAQGRVHLLSQRAFVTPGPRLPEALRELLALLHPAVLANRR